MVHNPRLVREYFIYIYIYIYRYINIGRPDKGTSVISLTTTATATAMFPNADDHLRNCVRNPSQYN